MADYQFARIEWAAKSRSKPKTQTFNGLKSRGGGWSARDLAAEAERKPGHCDHVDAPQPPIILYGVTPSEVADLAEKWANSQKDAGGRKLAKNSPCLAGGVISCPRSREDVWPALRDAAIEHLKLKLGTNLKSVIEHADEAHPHLHFYAVAPDDQSFGAVHPGYKARRASRLSNETGHQQGGRYRMAMKEWQNEIFENVFKPFDFLRTGPERDRLPREQIVKRRELEAVRKLKEAEEVERHTKKMNELNESQHAERLREIERHPVSLLKQEIVRLKAALVAADEKQRVTNAELVKATTELAKKDVLLREAYAESDRLQEKLSERDQDTDQ